MAGAQVTVVATQVEKQRLGYQAISLTHFTDNVEPQITAGSKVEIGSSLFEFNALESITGLAAIANSSLVYIKLTVSGTAVTASGTITAPTWSDSKQGWYTGADRVIGGLYKDAGGNYTKKWFYEEKQGLWFKRYGDGTIELLGAVTIAGALALAGALSGVTSLTMAGALSGVTSLLASGVISAAGGNAKLSNAPGAYTSGVLVGGASYVIPAGTFYFSGGGTQLQIYSGGSWRNMTVSNGSGFVFSDGSNFRLYSTSGGTWYLVAL